VDARGGSGTPHPCAPLHFARFLLTFSWDSSISFPCSSISFPCSGRVRPVLRPGRPPAPGEPVVCFFLHFI
jgi:hypothetical protein